MQTIGAVAAGVGLLKSLPLTTGDAPKKDKAEGTHESQNHLKVIGSDLYMRGRAIA